MVPKLVPARIPCRARLCGRSGPLGPEPFEVTSSSANESLQPLSRGSLEPSSPCYCSGSAGTILRWFRFKLNYVLRRASAAALRRGGRCATIRRRRLWQGVACVAFPHRHLHCISESLPNFACFLLFILPMFHVEHFYEISPLTVNLQLLLT